MLSAGANNCSAWCIGSPPASTPPPCPSDTSSTIIPGEWPGAGSSRSPGAISTRVTPPAVSYPTTWPDSTFSMPPAAAPAQDRPGQLPPPRQRRAAGAATEPILLAKGLDTPSRPQSLTYSAPNEDGSGSGDGLTDGTPDS